MNIQTNLLTFSEALGMVVRQYIEQGADYQTIVCDLYAKAAELEHNAALDAQDNEDRAMHEPR